MVLVLFCGVLDRPQATVQDDIEDAGGSQAPGRGQKPPGLFRDAARGPSDNRVRVDRTVFPTNGMVLIYKVLERGSFAWPKVQDGVMRLSRAQFEALFEDEEDQRC